MSARITLICQGPTAATRAAAFPLDEPLEERALAAAHSLGRALRRADRVQSSPALSARQTAAALPLAAEIVLALRDCDPGRWAGRRIADIQAEEPEQVMAWISDPDAAPHGGESLAMVSKRVSGWLQDSMTAGDHTIAVTHASIVRAAILLVLDAPLQAFWRIDAAPLSVAELSSDGRRWSLRSCGGTIPARGRKNAEADP